MTKLTEFALVASSVAFARNIQYYTERTNENREKITSILITHEDNKIETTTLIYK